MPLSNSIRIARWATWLPNVDLDRDQTFEASCLLHGVARGRRLRRVVVNAAVSVIDIKVVRP